MIDCTELKELKHFTERFFRDKLVKRRKYLAVDKNAFLEEFVLDDDLLEVRINLRQDLDHPVEDFSV